MTTTTTTLLERLLDSFNFQLPFGRWQSVEFNDLWFIPPFLKHDLQDIATHRWTHKLPFFRSRSPAEIAAEILNNHLEGLLRHDPSAEVSRWKLIDFGSGNGGPIPFISNHTSLPFHLSDLNANVNLDAWIRHASESENVRFIPQSCDASNPPFAAISSTTRGDRESARIKGFEKEEGEKVCRIYCNAFHVFGNDDGMAVKVLGSTMMTSDGFVILELWERRIFSLVLVMLEVCLFWVMGIFWFWGDWVHLVFCYVVPLLPVMQALDGFFSCLRMRDFEEFLRLFMMAHGSERVRMERQGNVVRFEDWEIKHIRVLHTWPFGYMNVITGVSIAQQGKSE